MRTFKVIKISIPYLGKTIIARIDKPFKNILLQELEDIFIDIESKMQLNDVIPENLIKITTTNMDEDTYLMVPKKIKDNHG
jgi:hypothetical protein